MSAPLLSVIVPVYKARECLSACVESILAQGLEDMEILLVEDGCPQGSGPLCDEWAQKDSRIRALHRPNGGASAARNTGLEAARGRYITFVDADDTLLPGLYPAALAKMEEEGLDWYGFGVAHTSGAANPWPQPGFYPGPAALGPQLEHLAVKSGLLALLYNKIYTRQLLENVRFNEALPVNEDLLFNLEALKNSGPFYLCADAFYLYEDTAAGSLSRRLRTDLLDAEETTRPAFEAFLAGCGLGEEEKARLLEGRRADVCRLQFFLLTGQKGKLPLGQRRALLARCLAHKAGRQAILAQLQADQNSLLALPYRFCARLNLPGLLALYCAAKEPFLS